ncbi:MAG: DUF3857 and transglutaminase domain-containing protein [Acidobacteriales bacterium]|nr:DUF3857 and transglutaminase domain-containing protein [Terriglobales bacterium]
MLTRISFKTLFLLLFSLALVVPVIAAPPIRSLDWLPITPAELQMKEVPGKPGAPAVLLFYADYQDDNESYSFIYRRIKILSEKGRQYADVEIPYLRTRGWIADLKARTIRPDGSIVEFKGKPFDKTVVKGRGFKYLAKTFSFPDVTIGSIVEYKYKVRWESEYLSDSAWTLQHDLYTLKASYSFYPYQKEFITKHGSARIGYAGNRRAQNIQPKHNQGRVELELENIAAFDEEEYSPPEDELKPQIRFYYGGSELKSPQEFWNRAGKDWYEAIENFVGNRKEIREAAQQAVGSETNPEKKLRALYARAQQVRNLTYERDRTAEEEKKEKLKDNANVGDVLKRGYGYRSEINRFFVALARAAGFEASAVRVSNRDDHFFDPNVLSESQLDSELTVVNLNGKEMHLDPGTRFCPFGLVRWTRASAAARKLDKNGGTFYMTPGPDSLGAITRRNGEFTLQEDGTLKGKLTVELTGQEALSRRLDALDMDDTGRTKDLEDDVKSWIGSGANLKLEKVTGWEASEEPLVAEFTLEIPAYASFAGKRMLLPTGIFQAQQKNPFSHAERIHPVYFRYPYQEVDNLRIKLPAGYSLENMPRAQEQNHPAGRIVTRRQSEAGELFFARGLELPVFYVAQENYNTLRDFFNKVQAVDEEQAVLRRGDPNVRSAN